MPLPWAKKNSKVGRISRIVADLQSPTTRGNSLVVETGFPTSLVDLFVKNRDRLKKPTVKKKKNKRRKVLEQEQSVVDEVVISDPILLSASTDMELVISPTTRDKNTQVVKNLEERANSFDGCELVSEDSKKFELNRDFVQSTVADDNNDGNDKRLFVVAVLKMLMVVVLGLSGKKLVVGITMSAFLLIFLEYIGKHSWFLKPCIVARAAFEHLIQRFMFLYRFSRISREVEKCEDLQKGLIDQEGDGCDLVDSLDLNSGYEEIEVVESNPDRLYYEGRETEAALISCVKRLQYLDTEMNIGIVEVNEDRNGNGVTACEKDCCQSAKIKRKMVKKLVPKQWLGKKNGKKGKEKELDSKSKECSCWKENKLGRSKVLEEQENRDKESKVLIEQEKELYRGIYVSSTELKAKMPRVVVTEKIAIKREANLSYLVLLLVVLAGLVGGRVLAFLLTVTVCVMSTMIHKHRRCVNQDVNMFPAMLLS